MCPGNHPECFGNCLLGAPPWSTSPSRFKNWPRTDPDVKPQGRGHCWFRWMTSEVTPVPFQGGRRRPQLPLPIYAQVHHEVSIHKVECVATHPCPTTRFEKHKQPPKGAGLHRLCDHCPPSPIRSGGHPEGRDPPFYTVLPLPCSHPGVVWGQVWGRRLPQEQYNTSHILNVKFSSNHVK